MSTLSHLIAGATFAGLLSAARWKVRELPGTAGSARACGPRGDGHVTLVQVVQADDLELVESACRFAKEQHGEIVLVYVIEAPRRLRRGTVLEQAERDAGAALAAASEMALRWDVPFCTVIWRDQVMLHGVAAAASRYRAHLVLSYLPSRSDLGDAEAGGRPAAQHHD